MSNRPAVLTLMKNILNTNAPGGDVRTVTANTSSASELPHMCDVLVSAARQHANWLIRPGAAFLELATSSMASPPTNASSLGLYLTVPMAASGGLLGRRGAMVDTSAFAVAFARAALHTVRRRPCTACAQKQAEQRRKCRESLSPLAARQRTRARRVRTRARGAAAAAPSGSAGARIAVCVVGQLSRLELASKRRHLLEPTAALRPAALHVFLALEQARSRLISPDLA